ncbi:hypothetical protein T459_28052 [Capsicum annuum]|uniref:Anther-specific protein BCP1-like n=1 Tax=Capsicum annuum TaxID=4072 RepID=A0A2G2YFR7_CAPAN|nr:hypothetical protein T459_28052 [Capsicum annuum]
MARQIVALALIIFVVSFRMASAISNAPASSSSVAGSPVDNSVIGTLDGTVGGAAPVGGPVPEGAFANLSPESQSSGSIITPQLPTIFSVVVSAVVASSFLF